MPSAANILNDQAIRTVLIVEDDGFLLSAYKKTVERAPNVRAVTAANCATATQLAQEHRPELCFVDMQLGSESGIELIASLRAELPGVRCVLVSGYTTTAVTVAAMRAGAHDVITKPITANELLLYVVGELPPRDIAEETPSADRVMWEHMQRILNDCHGNRSEAARRLGVDRGTLKRWLDRRAPRR